MVLPTLCVCVFVRERECVSVHACVDLCVCVFVTVSPRGAGFITLLGHMASATNLINMGGPGQTAPGQPKLARSAANPARTSSSAAKNRQAHVMDSDGAPVGIRGGGAGEGEMGRGGIRWGEVGTGRGAEYLERERRRWGRGLKR